MKQGLILNFPGVSHSLAQEAGTARPPKLASSACHVLTAFFLQHIWVQRWHGAKESDTPRFEFSLWTSNWASQSGFSSLEHGLPTSIHLKVCGQCSSRQFCDNPNCTARQGTPACACWLPSRHWSAFFSNLAPMFDLLVKGQLIESRLGQSQQSPAPTEDPARRRGSEDGYQMNRRISSVSPMASLADVTHLDAAHCSAVFLVLFKKFLPCHHSSYTDLQGFILNSANANVLSVSIALCG